MCSPRWLRRASPAVLLLLAAACGDDAPTQLPPPVVTVSVEPDSVELFEGDTLRFLAVLRDAAGQTLSGREVTWSSSAPAVASIDAAGLVRAEQSGSAVIEASSEGMTDSATAIVMQVPASISLSPDSLAVVPGATMRFRPILLGERGDTLPDRLVEWESDDLAVATVDADGWVTAMGTGATTITASFDDIVDAARIKVMASASVRSVSVWWLHACAVTSLGEAYCWGRNPNGQLGDGTTNDSDTPVRVAGSQTFVSITAGDQHTCAVTPEGAAHCWGRNLYGALGTDQTTEMCGSGPCSTTPLAVEGGHTFSLVSSGEDHVCGVTTDNQAYCWGRNHDGQLGNDSAAETCGDTAVPCSRHPVQVVGGLEFESVSLMSYTRSCGLTLDGDVYCWGDDSTTPGLVPGGLRFSSFDGGYLHDCGVTADASAYCWGDSFSGAFGDGSDPGTASSLPLAVSGGFEFASISAGAYHTCGVVTDGAAYCWGSASSGQLGSGLPSESCPEGICLTPVPVIGGLRFESVSAGYRRTCGISRQGSLYCWGSLDGWAPRLIPIP